MADEKPNGNAAAQGQPAPEKQPAGGEPRSGAAARQDAAPAGYQLPDKFKGKSIEDVVKSYSELEGKLSESAKYKALADRIEQMGGLDALVQWAQYGSSAYQEAQRTRSQPDNRAAAGAERDPFETWETLTPREQAQMLQGHIWQAAQGYLNALVQQTAQAYAEQINQWQSALGRQWDIYRQVMGQWRKNPSLDPDRLLSEMAQIATGNVNDLLSFAANRLNEPQDMETRIKAAVEAARQDWERQNANRNSSVLTGSTRPAYQAPEIPKNKGEENALIIRRLIEQGIPVT